MGFLNQLWGSEPDDDGYKPEMPESTTFTNSFTGPWRSSLMFRTWVEDGINLDTLRLAYDGRQVLSAGSGAFYYWQNSRDGNAKAVLACQELGKKYGPNLCWRWEMPTAEVLGWNSDKNPVEVFGETRSQDVDIAPLTSRKNRHKYQMIVLPSALQALALVEGLIPEPVVDFAALLNPLRDKLEAGASIGDDMTRLIGSEREFADSVFWKARVKLWKVFGEDNPQVYMVDQGGKSDVTSPLMKEAMGLIYKPQKFWATIAEAPDPHVDSVGKGGKHWNIWFIQELFVTREAAVAKIGESVIPEMKGSNGSNGVVLPQEWRDLAGAKVEDWLDSVRDIVTRYDLRGKSQAEILEALAPHEAALKETYFCTPQDVAQAIDHI